MLFIIIFLKNIKKLSSLSIFFLFDNCARHATIRSIKPHKHLCYIRVWQESRRAQQG